jgi:esterase
VSVISQIRVNGVSLYHEEHGTGNPILCIHGAGSSALAWGDAVPELARRGRVIVYDRRGCTRSERPDPYDATSVAEQADDASALLEALEAKPAVVIGRSYRGEIAVDLVQRYPDLVRALVLLEPAIFTLSEETLAWADKLFSQVRATAASDGPAAAADRFYRVVLGDATRACPARSGTCSSTTLRRSSPS